MSKPYVTIYTRDAKLEYTKEDYYKLFFAEDHYVDRKDGPAVEWLDGSKHWYIDNRLHRLDGPAAEWADGTRGWWIDDVCFTEDECNKLVGEVRDMPEVLRLVDPRKWVRDFNLKTI